MKILEARPISVSEAKEILLAREKRAELGYEQKLATEHVKKFGKLKPAEARKLLEELKSIVRASPETLVTIVDLLPRNEDEVRLIFAHEKFSLKQDEIKSILDVVQKYR